MFEALLDGAAILGPLYLVMLTPILIPLVAVGIGAFADQIKKVFSGL